MSLRNSVYNEGRVSQPTLILASASPRRQELLSQIGVGFKVIPVHVDESRLQDETPEAYVKRLAYLKAHKGWARTRESHPVLGADTAVVLGAEILGKPKDKNHALAMLEMLSGKRHRVLTAVSLVSNRHESTLVSNSYVTFRALTSAEMEAYWACGEPHDKAGAYAIQGKGAIFVLHLEGSYSGVMGLPIFETARLLAAIDIDPLRTVRIEKVS